MRFVVTAIALGDLLLEALVLLHRVVQLAEGVAQLEAAGEELKPLHVGRVVGLGLGERRDLHRVVVDDGRLNQERLHNRFEEVVDRLAHRRAFHGVVVDFVDRGADSFQLRQALRSS